MMGFDLRLKDVSDNSELKVATNHGNLDVSLSRIGIDAQILDAGGLARKLEVTRLPDGALPKNLTLTHEV